MSSPSEAQIEELAHAACSRPASERAQFLDEACRGDPELRHAVEQFVFPQAVLKEPVVDSTDDTNAPTAVSGEAGAVEIPPALRIDSYKLLGVLGEGGMGVVYRAEQENPHRVVALKVLKAGNASAQALKRFEHEAEVLGRLQHPGIAQIFEAGTADTEYGRQPFFAMELIDGVPLKKHVENVELSIRERLALLVKIGEAVQHAHQKGVIHRDLKPSNILVDERGQPKILDFGIAVVTDEDLRPAAPQTDPRQLAGTVPYMSLEQAKGDPNELDTRTDVYALGVIAYQLLADRLPFDLEQKTIAEAAQIISGEKPRPLGSIAKVFRGDIEAIVGKALERDKRLRYQSASDLAADIRRYLADEPILARPPSAMYSFSKLAKRNKALVGGILGVFVMLVAAIVGTSLGLQRAIRAEAKARAINQFLVGDLLASADPDHPHPRKITVEEVLENAAQRIDSAFAEQPAVEASIRSMLGQVYSSLGLYEAAEAYLRRAGAIYQTVAGENDPDCLQTSSELGVLLRRQGNYEEAVRTLRQTVERQRRILGETDEQTLFSMNELALALKDQGQLEDATELYRQTFAGRRRTLGDDHPDTLETTHNLASVLQESGASSEAERLFRRAYEGQSRVLGEDHKRTLLSANSLALLLKKEGKPHEAEVLYRQILESQGRVLSDKHPDTLVTKHNLANALYAQDNWAEAEQLFREILTTRQEVLGGEHPDTLSTLTSLGSVLRDQRKFTEAEPIYHETLERRRRILGEDHPNTLISMNNLAALLQRQGKLINNLAARLQRQGELEEAEGKLEEAEGKLEEAERLYRETFELLRRKLGDRHRHTIATLYNVAGVLNDRGEFAEAESLHRRVLELRRATLPVGHPEIASSLISLGRVLMEEEDPAGAEPLLRECLALRRQGLPEGHWLLANTESVLGECLTKLRRFREAEPLVRGGYPVVKARWGEKDERTQRARDRAIRLYESWGRPEQAEAYRTIQASPD